MASVSLVHVAVLAILCCSVTVHSAKRDQFRVVYEWNSFDFKWPDEATRQDALSTGKYVKENVIIAGIRPYGDRLYLTLPRMKAGVPATLAWIPATVAPNDTSPALEPFPSWAANAIGDCKSFQSVQSVEIDKSGTMWIIDNGRTSTINPGNTTAPSCPPTLTLIDLNNTKNSFVRYTFPESVASNKSYLNDLVVDDTDSGYAYITDNSGMDPGIIVFSRKDSRSWKVREANSMRASQNAMHFSLNGSTVDLSINVDGIAMGPRYLRPDGLIDRNVYFCPLASYKLYSISASVLRNESIATQPARIISQFIMDMGIKPSQTDGMIMDEEGILFYGLVGNHSIAQWDSRTNFATEQHVIARDANYIQWADRFGFDNDGNLYVVVNKLLNFVAGNVNATEVNYRILKSHVGTRSYLYGPPAELFNRTVPAPAAPASNTRHNAAAGSSSTAHSASTTKSGGESIMASTAMSLIVFLFSLVLY